MESAQESEEASADNTEPCPPVNPTVSVRHGHGFYLRGSDDATYQYVRHLEQEIERWKRRTICLEHLKANDQELESFTGFPTYGAFKSFFSFVEPLATRMVYWGDTCSRAKRSAKILQFRTLSLEEEFLSVMVRLQCGYRNCDER